MRNPEEAAKDIIEEGYTIEQYERVQARRRERLAIWEERGVEAIVVKERELIAFGEAVLAIMRKHKG